MPDERVLEIRQENLDPADIKSSELLLQAEASVVSAGTELANFTALSPGVWIPGSWNAYPWRPGYGMVGNILAVGSDITDFHSGQRVFCFGKHASLQRFEISSEGPYSSAFQVDPELPASTIMMARMALIGIAGPQMTDLQSGDTVVIFGLGLVGNLAAQLYQISGAEVIGVDPVPERCQIARQTGIERVVNVPIEEQMDAIRDLINGADVEVAVDAVGQTPIIQKCVDLIIQKCVDLCKPHGQVILLGSPRKPYETNATKMLRTIHHRWIQLRGALEWRLPAYSSAAGEASIDTNLKSILEHIKEGRLKIDPLITHVITPDQLQDAYTGLLENKENYLGVIIDWSGNS
jgi:2-desacetyl-2-hydroxyethyl bacteriochlorophyllide A dehydrogenase